MPVSGIQDGGNQPQPGFSISPVASSDWRETHMGSTSRSSRGPMSVSDSGGTGPTTKYPEPGRERIVPSAANLSYASTTVDLETFIVAAKERMEGSFAPLARSPEAIRC